MSKIIKYATGYVKGNLSIVSLERDLNMWWVRSENNKPFSYHSDLYTFRFFAERNFWKLVNTYGLKVTEFKSFEIDKNKILDDLIKKPCNKE